MTSALKSGFLSQKQSDQSGLSLPLVLVILMVSLIPAGIFMGRLDRDVSKQIEARGQRDAEMYLRSRLAWITKLIEEGTVAVNCSGQFWFPTTSTHSVYDKARLEIESGKTFSQYESSLSLRLCIYPATKSLPQLESLLSGGDSLSPLASECTAIGGQAVAVTITPMVSGATWSSGEKSFSLKAEATVPVGFNNQTGTWRQKAVTLQQALPQVCMPAAGTLTVNAGLCPPPTRPLGWGVKDLTLAGFLAGFASGTCANGIFSAESVDIFGDNGKASSGSGGTCTWPYSMSANVQGNVGTSNPNIIASYSSGATRLTITAPNLTQVWAPGNYSASGDATAASLGTETMNINATYSAACKCQ